MGSRWRTSRDNATLYTYVDTTPLTLVRSFISERAHNLTA